MLVDFLSTPESRGSINFAVSGIYLAGLFETWATNLLRHNAQAEERGSRSKVDSDRSWQNVRRKVVEPVPVWPKE